MSKSALLLLAFVLWVAPAVVAGMLDWPGIWGGGSAFSDLIVPAPITGGILHVPSFVVTLFLVRLHPGLPDRAGFVLRLLFFVAALTGLFQVLDLDRLYESLTTDTRRSAIRLEQDYFGLCLLTDASIASIWLWVSRLEARD